MLAAPRRCEAGFWFNGCGVEHHGHHHAVPDEQAQLENPTVEAVIAQRRQTWCCQDMVANQLIGVLRLPLWFARCKAGAEFNLTVTLARLGRLFPAHTVLLSALRGGMRLMSTEKEIVIWRVVWRLGRAYEYTHHHHVASERGVTASQIAAATMQEPDCLSPRLTALLVAA
jgi:Carboxymuconolactone decarboxylase family